MQHVPGQHQAKGRLLPGCVRACPAKPMLAHPQRSADSCTASPRVNSVTCVPCHAVPWHARAHTLCAPLWLLRCVSHGFLLRAHVSRRVQ